MEEILFGDVRKNDALEWFILCAITKGKAVDEITERMRNKGELRISFKINDIELPFLPVFEDLENHCEKSITKRAVELINEKFDNLDDILFELIDDTKTMFTEKFEVGYDE